MPNNVEHRTGCIAFDNILVKMFYSGKGLVDAAYAVGGDIYLRFNARDNSQSVTSSRYHTLGVEHRLANIPPAGLRLRLQSGADWDGDGVGDLLLEVETNAYPGHQASTYTYYGLGLDGKTTNPSVRQIYFQYVVRQGTPTPRWAGRQLVDINGDGLTDIFYSDYVNGFYRLNTGAGLSQERSLLALSQDQNYPSLQRFVDYNNDGQQDLIWRQSLNASESNIQLRLWRNGGFEPPVTITSVPRDIVPQFLDLNGDQQLDYAQFSKNYLYTYLGTNPQAQRINRITNGIANVYDISYEPMTTSDHYTGLPDGNSVEFYRQLNSNWDLPAGRRTIGKKTPVMEFTAPIYLVTKVQGTAPIKDNTIAQSSVSYFYNESKIQAAGLGLLGFKRIATRDDQTNVVTTTRYRQDFPFTGLPLSTTVQSPAGKILSTSNNFWQLENWNNGAPPAPYQPYILQTVEKAYNLVANGTQQGDVISTTTTSNVYDDYISRDNLPDIDSLYGNITGTKVTTRDGQGTVVSTITTQHSYGDSDWSKRMGRLSRTDVTTTRGSDTRVRSSAFKYIEDGPLKGLLHEEIIEPDTPAFRLTTTYEYDTFGNKQRSTVSGADIEDRTTTVFFDSDGRYPTHTVNAYGQTTERVLSRNVIGQPLRVININNVETQYHYGALGRLYFEASQTGAFKQTLLSKCVGQCSIPARYLVDTKTAGGGHSIELFDALGRKVRTSTRQFDGDFAHVDTEYNNRGQMIKISEPHSGLPEFWTATGYDLLGRPISTALPGISNPATIRYDGLTTVTTNPLNQTKTENAHIVGTISSVQDNINGTIHYTYNAHGDLTSTTHESNTVRLCYDKLGRKVAMSDPDKGGKNAATACPAQTGSPVSGWWGYQYNVLGELVRQIDAKGQESELSYDLLGRMVNRIDRRSDDSIEGNTTWTYDNDTSGSDMGVLLSERDSVSGYMQTMAHDRYGRVVVQRTTIAANDTHIQRTTFDQFGRRFQRFDGTVDVNSNANAIVYEYTDSGYLEHVKDASVKNSVQETYYTVKAMDLRGNVVESLTGNGVTSNHYYNAATGRLDQIQSNLILGTGDIQELHYTWDDIGNLDYRHDKSGSKDIREAFSYDGLNRLTNYQVEGYAANVVEYNGLGNITFKTDVCGTTSHCYSYGSNAGPHAVTHVKGETYTYDDNGNNISGGGRTIEYSTFDKPLSITKGLHTTQFKYAPNRARYLRTDTENGNTTTTQYLSDVEKITKPDNTQQIKRYLPGNVIITIKLDSAGTQTDTTTHYVYKDHLGSTDVITNEIGGIVQQLSFDAWGQRRNDMDWTTMSAIELANFDHSITTRAFTGHEALDEIGLIHMNGRIYDPHLGRFLQADPIIQSPTDTQSYNRYSYVMNNPLSYTDPTGYVRLSRVFNAVVTIASIALSAYCSCPASGISGIFAASGAIQAVVAGGNLGDIAIGAFTGAVTAYVGASLGIGGFTPTEALQFGAISGIANIISGGNFGHGFISAYVSGVVNASGVLKGVAGWRLYAASSIIGGTVSAATGGKFANGAAYAAFASIVSEGVESLNRTGPTPESKLPLAQRQAGARKEIGCGSFLTTVIVNKIKTI